MCNSVLINLGRNGLKIQSIRHFSNTRIISEESKTKKCNHHHHVDNNNSTHDTNAGTYKQIQEILVNNDQTQSHTSKNNKEIKSSNGTSFSYCVNLVRQNDYENYLCTLLLPDKTIRSGMFAIRAFNTEVAMIRDQVTQKEIGIGRLIFWRDSLNQLYQKRNVNQERIVPRHPVLIELSKIVADNNISKKWLSSLIESRERILTDAPFSDLPELEAYCDQSITSVLYLALELSGVKSLDVDHAASHLGKAIGLSNFIRSLPYNAQRRRVLVPQSLLLKHNISQENFIRNTKAEKIQDVIYEIASQAHTHYEKAKSFKTTVMKYKTAFPVFLSGLPSLMYLQRLQKLNFNAYDATLSRRNGLLPLNLYYKKLTKSYY